jgi:hypothetical protein
MLFKYTVVCEPVFRVRGVLTFESLGIPHSRNFSQSAQDHSATHNSISVNNILIDVIKFPSV